MSKIRLDVLIVIQKWTKTRNRSIGARGIRFNINFNIISLIVSNLLQDLK
ncbi:hypothetical protein BG20_I0939 [Candidatus Nitrosarchaeum limnium BG20]|uniref:Uncharacterized protein n=1 Tax=Candidatus Nitrosarchaeum limnium BG20 TaxID=859192 RepID=S2EIT5_9ARCH|nr:hypothetical protein BG20_I0939 [Candidatus Nitrosarchaeum limnium BG20]